MQRRHFLSLALALPLAGCGGGWQLGFGPVRGGGSSNTTSGLTRSTGRVTLPTGSLLRLDQLTLTSGLNAATLKGDGSFTLDQLNTDSALLVLADSAQRPVLLGFSGNATNGLIGEVSPLQTSVALLFYALGAFTLPADTHERVRTLLTQDSRVQALASQLTRLLATNPYALADSDPTLVGAVATLRETLFPSVSRAIQTRHRDQPLDPTLIQTTPENQQSGYLASSNADGLGLTITNTLRRNAIVSIYETAYTNARGERHTLAESIFVRHQILNGELLYGTSGLAGVLGSLIDVANGTVAYGPVSNGPYNLDMFPSDATQVEYQINIVANGNGGDPSGLSREDPTLTITHKKVCFVTFGKDVLLPALATFIGFQTAMKEAFKQQNLPGTELLKAFDDLAVILSGVVDSGIAISAGSVRNLLVAVLKAIANNGTLRQKVIEWLVLYFGKFGFTQSLVAGTLGGLASSANVIVIAIDKLMGAGDIGAVLADWGRSDSYIRFDAKVIAAKVKISPTTSTLNAGDPLSFRASTTITGATITYHWRVVSGGGSFKNPTSGLTGTSIDSASADMQYLSDSNAKDGDTVVIELEGFTGSVNDPNRASIGKATATLTIQKKDNLIQNGDFSNGLTSWKQVQLAGGSFGGYPKFSTSTPWNNVFRSGNPAVNIDVPGGADGYISQTVTLPDRALTLSLVAWNNYQPAQLTISIVQGVSETILDTPSLPSITTYNSGYIYSGASPVPLSYALDAYKGKTVEVRFRATASGYDGTVITLDDIAIR